jgi:muramoyltetrapeptide carboxypeptidase LdcA involved in peptidoglycan recycling
MIKVRKLKKGSKIAIISPSNGLPYKYPDIYRLGLKNMRDYFGFEIEEYPTANMDGRSLYLNPKLRADDINRAFEDDTIDGIICSIGGYESVRILEYLDVNKIIENPKLIMGFSDAAAFISYLNYKGLVTFYGPSVMAGFAQMRSLPEKFRNHVNDILINDKIPYNYTPYEKWTNGYKDWNDKKTLGECTEFYQNTGFKVLQGKEDAEGYLWGGCIEVLEFLKGTKFWPDSSFWNDKILIFETSEEKPLPDKVGYMLRNYGTQGILNKVKGIIFGRPKDYSPQETEELIRIIADILNIEYKTDMPVFFNVDFGHTDPKLILPLGLKVKLSIENNGITLMESPFY